MSEITKHAGRCKFLWGLIRAILLIGPLVGAFLYALSSGQIESKNTIIFGVAFAFIIFVSLINILCKFHSCIPGWAFIFFCIWLCNNIHIILIIIGVCSIVEEILAKPFYEHYKKLYEFNKEYDRRQEMEKRLEYAKKKHKNESSEG